ncbi:C4-dicarboxylate ABC transporter [Paramagnetospirillum kuznetsovii]|uniref:C4-dicarboxylate ABC transporter n=1 Tax=Paramagnetospirillum kuznetsovii TaxID=2053833 RepID=A0A364P1V2_9PROT|nr:TAXI family TRAP transporter solute-binding subunit [Paramagnetospirillum kuznetsovii]RAU23276.1 C4-dicarboxylate ABC transporter [Paramagnetospirillum kuznetsovii]
MRNRTRILLLASATLLLTAMSVAAVVAVNEWYRAPAALTFAVGVEKSPEAAFANKLAETLRLSRASIRLTVVVAESRAQALSNFTHHEADLAIIRTDDAKIPTNARAVAVLEHEALLLIGAKRAKIATLGDLQGKRVAVIGRDGRNEVFLRRLLEQYKFDFTHTEIRTLPPGTAMDKLLPASADMVVMFYPLSRLGSSADFQALAHAMKGFTVHALADSKALARKIPGIYPETIEAGLLSGSPRIPEDDMETVALQKILVVRRGLPEQHVVELMRALFENGRQLAVENAFATKIEPPDTEKGALIAVHDGANQYVESEVKSFFDRYSDLIYIGMSVASVLGSLAVALYGTVFRRRPRRASERTVDMVALCHRIAAATDAGELAAIESAMAEIMTQVLNGLADGSLSRDGLDAFRLAYDHARTALAEAKGRF